MDEVRLETLEPMRAVHVHALSENPEEDAGKEIMGWAQSMGLLKEGSGSRLFGRNTFPTSEPEPHGYELYLTIGEDVDAGGIDVGQIPGGLYAVLRFTNLENIGAAWKRLFSWIEEGEYQHVGWKKGEHGWADGFEEHLDFWEEKPQSEWTFDLWAKLKE